MKFNLHTHTKRCHHAEGADEEFVLKAIEAGYEMIGFSDHAPYLFPKNYYSNFRVELKDADDYVRSVRYLQDKYKDKIDIKLGFETEWYPELFDRELEYLKGFNYDFLILGQHFTDNEYEGWAKYSGRETDNVAVLDKYVSQLILGAKTGEFTYVCHPDLINFTGDREIYKRKMRHMCEALKKLNIPLEYNFLGYYSNRQYPNDDFWTIAKEVGNPVVVGLDAHFTYVYGDKRLNDMLTHIEELGIKPIDEITLIGAGK